MLFARRWLPPAHSEIIDLPRDIYSGSSQLFFAGILFPPKMIPPRTTITLRFPILLPRRIAESDGEREMRFKPPRDFFRWKILGFFNSSYDRGSCIGKAVLPLRSSG